MRNLVAVYGTLKRGSSNYHYMEHAEFLGEDNLDGITLYDLGPYPGALPEPSAGIRVEVFAVNASTLARLDELEGYNSEDPANGLYTRTLYSTRYGLAWVYLYTQDVTGCRRISSGTWC